MANDALGTLERFRIVAMTWTVRKRQADLAGDLTAQVRPPAAADDNIPF
jgi:hypothetical protein